MYSKGATLGGDPILYAWKIHKKATTPEIPMNNNELIIWILLRDQLLSKNCQFWFEESLYWPLPSINPAIDANNKANK